MLILQQQIIGYVPFLNSQVPIPSRVNEVWIYESSKKVSRNTTICSPSLSLICVNSCKFVAEYFEVFAEKGGFDAQ
jgi:hypothetical protein